MENEWVAPVTRLLAALFAGGLIGLERTYHGRPAGFRTHALVCMSSTVLMLLPLFMEDLITTHPGIVTQMDPTRMAQGIITGIGFLGAGVILKESFTIRGLTTAASIWMTASIGIVIGLGYYWAALVAEILAFGTLSVFRLIESKVPSLQFAKLTVWCPQDSNIDEAFLKDIFHSHGLGYSALSYQHRDDMFQYETTLRTRNPDDFKKLSESLNQVPALDYNITVS